MSSLHNQISGQHYKRRAIQPIQYIDANQLGYMEGCAIKYITRHQDKGKADDIKKAIHYLQMLLELRYGIEPDADPAHPPAPETVEASAELKAEFKKLGQHVTGISEIRTNLVAFARHTGNRWQMWEHETGQWVVAPAWCCNAAPGWQVATAEQIECSGISG